MGRVVEHVGGFVVLEGVKEGDAVLNDRLHRAGAGRREAHGPEMVDVWRWRKGQDPDDERAKENHPVLVLIDRIMIAEEMVDMSRVAQCLPNIDERFGKPHVHRMPRRERVLLVRLADHPVFDRIFRRQHVQNCACFLSSRR